MTMIQLFQPIQTSAGRVTEQLKKNDADLTSQVQTLPAFQGKTSWPSSASWQSQVGIKIRPEPIHFGRANETKGPSRTLTAEMMEGSVSRAIISARKQSESLGILTLEHVLLAMLNDEQSGKAFRRLLLEKYKIAPDSLKEVLDNTLEQLNDSSGLTENVQPKQDSDFAAAFSAMLDVVNANGVKITPDLVLAAALRVQGGRLARVLPALSSQDAADTQEDIAIREKFFHDTSLEVEAGKTFPVIGRDKELQDVLDVVNMTKKGSAVLLGEAGVGKTSIWEKIAYLNATGYREVLDVTGGKMPESQVMKDQDGEPVMVPTGRVKADGTQEMRPVGKRALELKLSLLADPLVELKVGEDAYRGEEVRAKVLDFIKNNQNRYTFFIDELHMLNDQRNISLANQMKPYLARHLNVVSSTTKDEWDAFIAKDKALERRFTPVEVNEPSVADTLTILRGIRAKTESSYHVEIRDDALKAAAEKGARYISGIRLPDSAITVLNRTCSRKQNEVTMGASEMLILVSQAQRINIDINEGLEPALKQAQDDLDLNRKALDAVVDNFYENLDDLPESSPEGARFKVLRSELGEHYTKDWLAQCLEAVISTDGSANQKADQKMKDWGAFLRKTFPDMLAKTRSLHRERNGILFEKTETEKQLVAARKEQKRIDDELAASRNLKIEPRITVSDILQTIEEMSRIPVSKLTENETEELLKLEDRMGEHLIGQNDAVRQVCSAVRAARTGAKDPKRPSGSFLFLGPTGVGKTEIARLLAKLIFGDEDALIQIDMSEYGEKHTVARLVGSPPGYVGYEAGGQLTEKVKNRPFSVVLFDEVEKAHPEVFNLLLQILEDGRLTDGQGKTVSFKDCIVILTSNIGSQQIFKPFEPYAGKLAPETQTFQDTYEDARRAGMKALKTHTFSNGERLKPEFLNRLDATVIFHPHMDDHIRGIVGVQNKRLNKNLSASQTKIQVEIEDSAREYLVEKGSDPKNGARPLKRLIDNLSQEINTRALRGEFHNGQTILLTRKLLEEWLEPNRDGG